MKIYNPYKSFPYPAKSSFVPIFVKYPSYDVYFTRKLYVELHDAITNDKIEITTKARIRIEYFFIFPP